MESLASDFALARLALMVSICFFNSAFCLCKSSLLLCARKSEADKIPINKLIFLKYIRNLVFYNYLVPNMEFPF